MVTSLACVALMLAMATACTNFIVTKGASSDGFNSISYTDDGGNNYGEITLLRAADHPAGAMRKIWRWEDGKYLGEIPEAAHTYHVVGNMNEHQLSIGETTFTGRPELRNPLEIATMDYANLMSLSLQRARTAREAIALIDRLTTDHGYASTGESLTIADPDEIWHMEIAGRGREKGAVWVARRAPDGSIGGHANQARITTFPHDDPEDTRFSADLVAWARRAPICACATWCMQHAACSMQHAACSMRMRVWCSGGRPPGARVAAASDLAATPGFIRLICASHHTGCDALLPITWGARTPGARGTSLPTRLPRASTSRRWSTRSPSTARGTARCACGTSSAASPRV